MANCESANYAYGDRLNAQLQTSKIKLNNHYNKSACASARLCKGAKSHSATRSLTCQTANFELINNGSTIDIFRRPRFITSVMLHFRIMTNVI